MPDMTPMDTTKALDPKALASALDDPYAEIHRTTVVKAIRAYLAALSQPAAPDHAGLVARLRNGMDTSRKICIEAAEAIAALSRVQEPVADTDWPRGRWAVYRQQAARLATPPAQGEAAQPAADGYQSRVHDWMMACFNDEIAFSRKERNHRFLEEALELVQAMGCTRSEAYQLVDYVFDRPIGEPAQEVGGVIVCLAALCTAAKIDMDAAGETELARIWTKVEKIRAKHAAKPQFSPLPGAAS